MGSSCCSQKPANDSRVEQRSTIENRNGVENLGYTDFHSLPDPNVKVVNKNAEVNQNGLAINTQRPKTPVEDVKSIVQVKNVSKPDNDSFAENDNEKKNNKQGVTFADDVDVFDSSKSSNNSQEKFPEPKQDISEPKPLSIPTIIVEHVDAPTQAVVQNNHMNLEEDSLDEKYKDLFAQPALVHEEDLIDLVLSDESANTSEVSDTKAMQKQLTDEENAELRRISLHLRNVADNVQKVASLIDRFDGVFMPLLHDEIEHNLKGCAQSVIEIECPEQETFVKRQEEIRQKILTYLIILDEKSEKKPTESEESPLESEVASTSGLEKIKELQEKVEALCPQIDKAEEGVPKIVYDEITENLQVYHDEIEKLSSNDNEELQELKDSLQGKIQKYLEIIKGKQIAVEKQVSDVQLQNDIVHITN